MAKIIYFPTMPNHSSITNIISKTVCVLFASTALGGSLAVALANANPNTQVNRPQSFANNERILVKLVQDLQRKDEQIAKHEAELAAQKQEIEELKKLVGQLAGNMQSQRSQAPAQVANISSPLLKTQNQSAQIPAQNQVVAATNVPSSANVKQVGLERRPVPKEQPPQISAIPQDGGVLLAPGKMVFETGFEYSRSSALRVAIEGFTIIPALSIGSFEISSVDRNTVTTDVNARFGVFKRFEMSVRVPYIYRDETTATRPIGVGSTSTSLSNVDGMNIGDVEVSGSYQINNGKEGWPFLIGNMRFKSATGQDPFSVALDPSTGLPSELSTGSGFYALQPSITAIYPTDPAVLYGSLGYTLNMARNVGGTYGEIDPGDSISYSMGMGFGINEKTSFSLGYSHEMIFETTQNGSRIPTSDTLHVAQMTTGLSHKLSESTNINLSVGAGLTDDAPDMRFGIKVPVKFNLW